MSSRSSSQQSSRSDSRRGSATAEREDRVVASVRAKHQDPQVSPSMRDRPQSARSHSATSDSDEGPEVPIENPREARSSRRAADSSRYRTKDKRNRDVSHLDRRVGDDRLELERRHLEIKKMEAELELKRLEMESTRRRRDSSASTQSRSSSDGDRRRAREGSRAYAPTSRPSKHEPLQEPSSDSDDTRKKKRKHDKQQDKHDKRLEAKRQKYAAKEKEREEKEKERKKDKKDGKDRKKDGGGGGDGDDGTPEEPSERMKLKAVLRLLETEPLAPMRPEVAACGLPNLYTVRRFVAACESQLDILQGGSGEGAAMTKQFAAVFEKLAVIAASATDPAVGARPTNRTAQGLAFHRKTSSGPVTLATATGVVDATAYTRGDVARIGYSGAVWGSSGVGELERKQNLLQTLLDVGTALTDERHHSVCDLCGDIARNIEDHYGVAHTDHPNNNTRYFKVHKFENPTFADAIANVRGYLNRVTSGMLASDAAKDPKVAARQREWSTVSTAFATARLLAHRKGFTAPEAPEAVLEGGIKGGVGGGTTGQTGWLNGQRRKCERLTIDDQAALRLLLGDTPILDRVNATLLDRARDFNDAVSGGKMADAALPSKAPPAAGEATGNKELVWQWFCDVAVAALQRLPTVPADRATCTVGAAAPGAASDDAASVVADLSAGGDLGGRFATLFRAAAQGELGGEGAAYEDPIAAACEWLREAAATPNDDKPPPLGTRGGGLGGGGGGVRVPTSPRAAAAQRAGPYPTDVPITWLSVATAVRASRVAVGYIGGGAPGDVLLVIKSLTARDLTGYADYHAGVEAAVLPGTWFRCRALSLSERQALGPSVGAALDAVRVYQLTEIDGSTGHGILSTFTPEEVYRNYQLLPLLNVPTAPLDADSGGNSALHLAAAVPRNASVVRTLLTSPTFLDRVNAQNFAGETPLHAALAAQHDDVATAAALLSAGADALIGNAQHVLPLHLALRNARLVRVGVPLLAMHGGVPRLTAAAVDAAASGRGVRDGNAKITGGVGVRAGEGMPNGLLRVLLNGVGKQAKLADGVVAGGIALADVCDRAAERLAKAGVDLRSYGVTQDTLRTTPLLLAAASPSITADLLKLVLHASPPRLAWQADQFGSSVLHTIAANPSCDATLVDELLTYFTTAAAASDGKNAADVASGPTRPAADGPLRVLNERDGYGLTPILHLAANESGCSAAACKALLDCGASIVVLQEGAKGGALGPLAGAVDRDGRTAVARATGWAHRRVDLPVIRLLVERSRDQHEAAGAFEKGASTAEHNAAGIAARLRLGEVGTSFAPVDIINAAEPGSAPPIHILLARDDVTADDVSEFNMLGAKLDSLGYGGQTVLHTFLRNESAVRRDCWGEGSVGGSKKGALEVLHFLLRNMPSDAVSKPDGDGLPPVFHAVSNPAASTALLDELVAKGANVTTAAATSYGSRSCLQQALSNPRVSAATVAWLIAKGVAVQPEGGADDDPEEHPLMLYLSNDRSTAGRNSVEGEMPKPSVSHEVDGGSGAPKDPAEDDFSRYALPTGAVLDLDVLRLLLEKTGAGNAAKLVDRQGGNVIHLAVRKTGDPAALRVVLKTLDKHAKEMLTASDHSGRTPLAVLCAEEHVSAEAVTLLLTGGADLKDPANFPPLAATSAAHTDHYGVTPLHVLCQNVRVRGDVIAALVPPTAPYAKAVARAKDGSGRSAAHVLAANRGIDAHPMPPTGLSVVVRRAGQPAPVVEKQTVLSEEQAARLGVSRTQMVTYGLCEATVTALAEAHADFGVVDDDGSSCVHIAAGNPRCTVPIVRILLNSAHTAANRANRQGKTAVDIADAVDRRDLKKEIVRHAVGGARKQRAGSDSDSSSSSSDDDKDGAAKELSDECEVRLVSYPDSARLGVIKTLLRVMPSLTSKAASKLASTLPAELGKQKRTHALEMKRELEAAGASVLLL